MIGYIGRRVLQAIPLLLALVVLNFLLIHAAPGDVLSYIVGDSGADPALAAQIRHRLGLDLPLHEQLAQYVGGVLTGDLGRSIYFDRPVLNVIIERVPATLLLMITQLALAILIGIPLGVAAARRRNTPTDNAISTLSVVGFSIPVFWSAQILILVFAVNLHLVPAQGMTDSRTSHVGLDYWLDLLWHLALPALTLAVVNTALIARITRASMIETLTREYIVSARAKGLGDAAVVWVHALRNSLLPIVTIVGLEIGAILAGTVVTETVFAWPGVGRLIYESIARRDYPVIMGGFLLAALGVLIANLLTDLVYGSLDPRIRIGRRPSS